MIPLRKPASATIIVEWGASGIDSSGKFFSGRYIVWSGTVSDSPYSSLEGKKRKIISTINTQPNEYHYGRRNIKSFKRAGRPFTLSVTYINEAIKKDRNEISARSAELIYERSLFFRCLIHAGIILPNLAKVNFTKIIADL